MQMPYRRLSRRGPSPLTTSKISLKSELISKRLFLRIWTNLERPKWFQWVWRRSCQLSRRHWGPHFFVCRCPVLGRLVTMSITGLWWGEGGPKWGRGRDKRLCPWEMRKVHLLLLFSLSVVSDALWHMHCGSPDFSVHGIFQARILEWVVISFCSGSSQPRDQTHISYLAGRFFTTGPPEKPSYSGTKWIFILFCVCIFGTESFEAARNISQL